MKKLFAQPLNPFLKAFTFTVAFIFLSKDEMAQMCANPSAVIYGLDSSGNILPINVSNASVGAPVNPSYTGGGTVNPNALGYNTINGKFYYFLNKNPGTQQFMSFDPTTNTYTVLATSPITAPVNRACVSFNGTAFYCLDQNANLCYYNILTNTWTLVTNKFVDQFGNNVKSTFKSEYSGDMAIDALGNLWIVSSSPTEWGLYKVFAPLPTTATASITVQQIIAPTTATPTGQYFAGIAFDPTGGIFMSTNNELYFLTTSYALNDLGAFSISSSGLDLTSCNFPFTMLSVSWENFNVALQENNSVSVSWEVSEQINNKGYYVERSIDGANWNQLGFVANSSTLNTSEQYSFNDNNPYNGINYYRVSQVDLDGNTNYSEIKSIPVESLASRHVSVWPNPAKDVISIQNNNDASSIARIYNQSGALVIESKLHSGINTVNVSSLFFGAYIISLKTTSGENYAQKFIKQ